MKLFSITALILTGVVLAGAQTSPVTIEAEVDLQRRITTAQWSPDGEILGVATYEGIYLFDNDLNPVGSIVTNEPYWVTWSPDSRQLAAVTLYTVEIWQIDPLEIVTTVSALPDDLVTEDYVVTWYYWSAAWSPGSERLAIVRVYQPPGVAEFDGYIEIFDTTSWEVTQVMPQELRFPMQMMQWDPTSTYLAVSEMACYYVPNSVCDLNPSITVWNTVTEQAVWRDTYLPFVHDLAWASDSSLLIASDTYQLYTYDGVSGNLLNLIDLNDGDILFDLSSNNQTVVVATVGNRQLLVIHVASGTELLSYDTNLYDIWDLDWNPVNDLVAVAEREGVIQLLDLGELPDTSAYPTSTPLPTPTARPTRTPTASP
jgi:WD40 repeat protein